MNESSGEGTQLTVWGNGERTPDATLVGDTVLKHAGPWTPALIALLRHLEDAGFTGAPRVIGDGFAADGRLAVSYVPGGSPHPAAWPEETVGRVGALLRELHDATAGFVAPPGAVWQSSWLHDLPGSGRVIGHCDTGPWNIVGRDGVPEAFIDWQLAGPVDPLWELAEAAWLNAQLHDDDIAALHGLPDAPTRARHLRAILDGYGLPRADRAGFVDRLVEVAVHSARAEAVLAGVTPDSTAAVAADGYPVLWAITWRARDASWMARNRRLLARSVS